jgi:hypothetical protein
MKDTPDLHLPCEVFLTYVRKGVIHNRKIELCVTIYKGLNIETKMRE